MLARFFFYSAPRVPSMLRLRREKKLRSNEFFKKMQFDKKKMWLQKLLSILFILAPSDIRFIKLGA